MFNQYIKKILPIPITDIEVSEDGYKYKIKTYANVLREFGVEKSILKRVKSNKRIKDFDGWYFDNDIYYKYAILEFMRGACRSR